MRDFHPGDEYARVLRLQRWFEWAPGLAAWFQGEDEAEAGPEHEGPTDPELLKQRVRLGPVLPRRPAAL